MTDNLKFGTPPTKYRREKRYDWDAILNQLRDNPEQWAILEEQGKVSIHNAISQGKISNFHPDMGIESRTAHTDFSVSPRRADIWVRYAPHADKGLTKKQADKVMVEYRKRTKEN